MSDIYAFDNENNNTELLIRNEIENQLSALKNIDWFHGFLDRKEAEKKIVTNGEFLVRLSPEKDSKFVVSTKWNGKHLHVIIKNDIDSQKKQLTYYIVLRFQFPSIIDLIFFHKSEQYPLSTTSEAVLYRPVSNIDTVKKDHKFRKSVRVSHKTPSKALPRCGSETYLGSQRYSATFQDINKSLTSLPTASIGGPLKPSNPSFRLFPSKLVLSRSRPTNIHIRNDKLYKESGDYSDYTQLKDAEGGLERERVRRGLSLDILSPSLFGLNDPRSNNQKTSKINIDDNAYLPLRRESASVYIARHRNMSNSSLHSSKNDADAYVPFMPEDSSTYVSMEREPLRKNSSAASLSTIRRTSLDSSSTATVKSSLTLGSFLNLSLSSLPLSCCGPIDGAFDKMAINKAASFLLSHPQHSLAICAHLLEEVHRIFAVSSAEITVFRAGYRCLFLIGSEQIQKDLLIRQTTLTNFVMATIVSTASNDRRKQLILFWIKCAENLLTHVNDMFHFRSVVTAIFSDQIASLKVWKDLYRSDSSMKTRMESMRKAISDGCFMQAEIDKCVPDFVQLYSVFSDADSDFEILSQLSLNILEWSVQSFEDGATWLVKITKQLQSITSIPFLRELVRTETLLSLILGRINISARDVGPLMVKFEECVRIMATLNNETAI